MTMPQHPVPGVTRPRMRRWWQGGKAGMSDVMAITAPEARYVRRQPTTGGRTQTRGPLDQHRSGAVERRQNSPKSAYR